MTFFRAREAKKGFGDEIPKRVLGTGACRAQWAKQAGGTLEIARNALRDYASFPERSPAGDLIRHPVGMTDEVSV